MVRLGYACINLSLKSQKVTCNRTCRLATIQSYSNSLERYNFLTQKSLENLENLKTIIQWHIDNDHYFYRLSSDMFPHISNPQLECLMEPEHLQNYRNLSFAQTILEEIGKLSYQHNIRLTMHPGQFNQLGSPNQTVVDKTFVDLAWQAQIFEIMEIGANKYFGVTDSFKDSTLCIHGGGVYGDKSQALQRWKFNFNRLPKSVQKRLALENCEKCYCVDDLLPICQEFKIPLIFDFFHYPCYDIFHPMEVQRSISELLPEILATWEVRKMTPKFHLSEQAPDKLIGAHSDYVETIPQELIQLACSGYQFDIMIEAKQKDLAMFYLLNKYSFLFNVEDPFHKILILIQNNKIKNYWIRPDIQTSNSNVIMEFLDNLDQTHLVELQYNQNTEQIYPPI